MCVCTLFGRRVSVSFNAIFLNISKFLHVFGRRVWRAGGAGVPRGAGLPRPAPVPGQRVLPRPLQVSGPLGAQPVRVGARERAIGGYSA